ncbi:NHLP leader peptide family RiPP precursor [Paenibacillus sp. FSL W8-0186]|uniref:NHLP leader peptide family natural product n=1 Tax=Paenibacillus woosongensis TaxID=307580 RepID=A0A7X2Z1N3_9BACL|nr:NHLP leader peptide family RiPP precursor [Paenibacillus woosongensis]MUG45946.1 NHLP leader peptide family natural product precursor [Paenibacillus woosongensis]
MTTSGALLQTQIIQKAWQDPSFKAKLLADPKAAIQEALGVIIPDHIKVKAVEENSDEFYLVLPPNPSEVIKSDIKPNAVWM